jgi:TolB-like protein
VGSLVLALAAVSAASYLWGAGGAESRPPVRIAIMPFESAIAEHILQNLSADAGDAVALVGPTTTAAYAGSDTALRQLAADYQVDYVINARPLGPGGRARVLAELIRVSDGAHVWVRPYDDLSDGSLVGADISQHVARVLRLTR